AADGSGEQKCRWLPFMARGELVAAIAMSEPGAGSDLRNIQAAARRDGDHYVINGSKRCITNGALAGLVCLAVKTDPRASGVKGISLIMVETKGLRGYRVGGALDKIGMHGQDTCELFFDESQVPATNLLGGAEGKGFYQMMERLPYERLGVGVVAVATAEQAVAITTDYVKQRTAFGKPLIELQNTRFKLAECKTAAHVGRVFVDHCIERFIAGQGFYQMMERLPYERLGVGVVAVATAEQAVAITTDYVKQRTAFGKPLIELQNTRFKLAECKTAAHVGRVFVDHCIERFIAGQLDDTLAAMAKYWLTDCQCRIVDECVQLHGGYGYMTEYPIARMWADSRVQRIYAGANEIMKELIACSL